MSANTEGREFIHERALDIAGDFLLDKIQEIAATYGKGMEEDRDTKKIFEAILSELQGIAQGLIDQSQGMQMRRLVRDRKQKKAQEKAS